MLKIPLLLSITILLNTSGGAITRNLPNLSHQIKYEFQISDTTDNALKIFGNALLESLKETNPEKLLALSLTIGEFKKTVKKKTHRKNKKKFIAEVAKEKEESLIKRTKENFNDIMANAIINWQQAEIVNFRLERQKERSENLGFEWGKGTLVFNTNGYRYELSIDQLSQLLSGWKGIGYRLSTGKEISTIKDELETYGKAFFEVLKTNDYDKLYLLCMSGKDLVNRVNEKTQIKEIKELITKNFSGMTTEKWQNFIKNEFDRIKKKYPINWQNIEYLKFKFEKNEGDSQDINFEWGKATLFFKADGKKYKFKFTEFAHLLTGWKGSNFRLHLD